MDTVINHRNHTTYCQSAASTVVGAENSRDFDPIMGGEDFGAFLQVRPAAFMLIGQGEKDLHSSHSAELHSPLYDFNDAILPIATKYFAEIAESRLVAMSRLTTNP